MKSIRILFCATHTELALPALRLLLQSNAMVIALATAPDRRSGRGQKKQHSPLKALAIEHNLPVLQPESLKSDEDYKSWQSLLPDIMVVAGYGLILPQRIIDLPRYGCINIHPSLLPKWRGASPVQAAILNKESSTGVTIIRLNQYMDAGDIITSRSISLEGNETTPELMQTLAEMGSILLMDALEQITKQHASFTPQDHSQATYCKKLTKIDGIINFSVCASEIDAKIRALQPWPSVIATLQNQQIIKIKSASIDLRKHNVAPGTLIDIDPNRGILIACKQNAIWLHNIQMPNKPLSQAYHITLGYPALFTLNQKPFI